MKIEELASLMGKTRNEVETMLKDSDVIELNLTERSRSRKKESGEVKIMD